MGLCLLLFPPLPFFLSSQPTRRPCSLSLSLCLPPFLSCSFFSGLLSPRPLPTTPPNELQMMTAIRKDVTSRASPVPNPFPRYSGGHSLIGKGTLCAEKEDAANNVDEFALRFVLRVAFRNVQSWVTTTRERENEMAKRGMNRPG